MFCSFHRTLKSVGDAARLGTGAAKLVILSQGVVRKHLRLQRETSDARFVLGARMIARQSNAMLVQVARQ